MRSKVALFDHPLHPMLVPLPIGLLTGSVLADFAYIINGRGDKWAEIAFWTLVAVIVTALLAAAAGFLEFWLMARYTDAREMATWHMILNLGAVVLFAVSLLLRLDRVDLSGGRFGAAFALSLVAIAVMAASGWIGGELSYRKHLGMVPDDATTEQQEVREHLVQR